MEKLISKNDIISAIAYWGIQQSPYLFPKNLAEALTAVGKRIDEKKLFDSKAESGMPNSYLEFEAKDFIKLIKDLIFNTPEIAIWNVTQVEQNNGITDPNDEKRTIKFTGTSRYGSMQDEDNSFIDLDALRMNICNMIFNDKLTN